MTAVARPRGTLPARVYWFRRLIVLTIAVLLVVGIARLLGSGDGSGPDEKAATVAGSPTDTTSAAAPGGGLLSSLPSPRRTPKSTLAKPDGPCDPTEVVITPDVEQADAGTDLDVILDITTTGRAACTFDVSAESVVVKIPDEAFPGATLWTTQQCPDAMPMASVIARREVPGKAVVTWDRRRSDPTCSSLTDWVLPGSYTVEAIAIGSTEPTSVDFDLGPVATQTVTRTPKPSKTPSNSPSGRPTHG